MLLHTDLLTRADMYDACKAAHVSFVDDVEEKGSRTRKRRFKFRLEGWTSHRYANSGKFGAANWEGNCATWDEWGIFLNVLFQRDPEAHSGKYGYIGLADYRWKTDHRFETLTHADQHVNHNWKTRREIESKDARQCECGAIVRYDHSTHLLIVKHGIVDLSDRSTIEHWLDKAPA